jgi:polyhydroxybutyrate depolymerase
MVKAKKPTPLPQRVQSPVPFTQHMAWGVVCLLLLASLLGIWTYAQGLENQVTSLKKQLIASEQPQPSTCKVMGTWQSNTTTLLSTGKRQYGVHVPQHFKPDSYYPLIMFYPGKGATAEAAEAAFGMNNSPAIIVYPHPTLGTDGYTAWQGAPYSSSADDVQFTANILDQLQTKLCIDRTKVYAIGVSNGGGFTSLLSCKLANRFAAVATIAGAMYAPDGNCQPPRPMPLISVHGDNDPIVPYHGSLTRHLPDIDSWTHSRAMINGCKQQSVAKIGFDITLTQWSKCRGNADVQNVRIVGGGHGAWNKEISTTVWQFLSRFSL